MKKQERLLFKIWDKRNEKYISGNGKTHWRSMTWIAAKLRDLCASNWGSRDINDFEVQTFELQLVDTQPGRVIFEDDEQKKKHKRMNKEIADRCKAKINHMFPTISVHQIRSLYRDGLMNAESMRELKPIIEQLVEAERNS